MNEREFEGLNVLQSMGLRAYGNLGDIQVLRILPHSSASPDDHFEFDYFILQGEECIVGEISGDSGARDEEKKYSRFRRHFDMLVSASTSRVFDHFALPREDRHLFDEVRHFRAFFIADQHERFDLHLRPVQNVAVIYRSEWDTLKLYARFMGTYARYPFLNILGIPQTRSRSEDLVFSSEANYLMRVQGRHIAHGIDDRVDVFTFVASPAQFLETAEVFRRELMPILTIGARDRYQRPLDFGKLQAMRKLVADPTYMFPNSILLALDKSRCMYDPDRKELRIPKTYGSVSVIDGQHRLFSYASRDIAQETRQGALILITALHFRTTDPDNMLRCSAKTFVEINREQKRISSDHLDEIAYPILGDDSQRALAAQVVLRCNQRVGKPLHGLFRLSQTTGGVYKAATVITTLAAITNLTRLTRLVGRRITERIGYDNLYELTLDRTPSADEIIEHGVVCLERYFGLVKRTFGNDWPQRGHPKPSNLEYAKVLAAFVQLLHQFIRDGLTWDQVAAQLTAIRHNILLARKLTPDYQGIVLAQGDETVPDQQPPVRRTFRYLDSNRHQPTRIADVPR